MLDPKEYYIDYSIKGLLVHGSNPIVNGCNPRYVLAAMEKLSFIVSIACHCDEPTQLADIVLPEDTCLEATNMYRRFRDEKVCTDASRGLYVTLVKRAVVDRVYNTRNANDIYMDLAKRLGILPAVLTSANRGLLRGDSGGLGQKYALDTAKVYSWDEMLERKIKNDWGDNAGFQDFARTAAKPERLPTVKESYNYFHAPENAVRLPFYHGRLARNWASLKKNLDAAGAVLPYQDMEDVARHYSGFAMWTEPPNYRQDDRFPFYVVQYKDHFTNQNTLDRVENPWLHDILDHTVLDSKRVLIPTTAAKKLGIREGDEVWVESEDGGKTRGKVHLSELIHPECIGVPGNYGRSALLMNPRAREGPNFNVLRSPDEAFCDPIQGQPELSPRVTVYRA
jgi:anaerobic selenocysteine-containing dehydrogenase